MLAYWDTFGELFGMPIRIGRTDSTDKGDWNKIAGTLKNMGAACYALVGKDTEIEIKETTRGDAFNVYDRRIDRANSEMSKAILGQTMTIDNGSSQSQSEVHLEVLKNLCASDAKEVKNVINDKLIPLMLIHGFPVQGCTFDWDNQTAYTPEQQRENERLVLQEYEIDPQYFIDKYKMPIIGRRAAALLMAKMETRQKTKS